MITLLVILFSLLLGGCQLFTAPELMERAERQMAEHPDSALATMRSVKKYAVLLPERRAKYGLLYTTALRKNRINIDSDSLIRFSTEYYDVHGTAEERMHSYYELGRVQQHAGENLAATLSYLDAAQYTDVVDDNYLKGLLYTNLSAVYELQFRYRTAFEMAEKSYNSYKEAGIERYQAFQLYKMGALCYNLDTCDKGIQLLCEAIALADKCNFQELRPYCYPWLILLYDIEKRYDEAYKVIKLWNSKDYNNYTLHIGPAAHVLHCKGETKEAKRLMDYGWEITRNSLDSSVMYYFQSKIHLFNRNKKGYFDDYTKFSNMQLEQISDIAENPIATAEVEYFEQKNRAELKRAQQEKTAVIILSVLFVAILCGVLYRLNKRQIIKKNSEIQKYIETISHLENSVNCSDAEMATLLDEKLKDRFNTINKLCLTYYECSENPRKQSIIFNKVRDIIDEIGCDKSIDDIVNRSRNNILVSLSEELPNLSTDEYKLASYLFAGFSTQTICVFFNCNKDALYNRKHRLREKIKKNNPPKKDIYLQYFR